MTQLDPGYVCPCSRKNTLPKGVKPRPFLVTGCGRSGTRYVADLFTAIGVPCGWERILNPMKAPEHRARDYKYCLHKLGIYGDSNWLAVPYMKRIPRDVRVIHLVRDPLKVIRSFLYLRFFGDDHIHCGYQGDRCHTILPSTHVRGLDAYPSAIERCMAYWVGWNRLCEHWAAEFECVRVRLEDLLFRPVRTIQMLADFIAGPTTPPASWPKNRHKRLSYTEGLFTWDHLPAGWLRDEVQQLAKRYGYE